MENQPDSFMDVLVKRQRQEKLKDCFLVEIRRKQVYMLNLMVLEEDPSIKEIGISLLEGLERAEKLFSYASNIPASCYCEPTEEFLATYAELQNIYTKEKARLGVK